MDSYDVVKIVHELEDEFYEIKNVPDNDPRLIKLHKFYNRIPNEKAISFDEDSLAELWKQGLTDSRIAYEIGCDQGTVKRHRKKLGEPNIHVWALNEKNRPLYFRRKIDLARAIGVAYSSAKTIDYIKKAESKGWTLRKTTINKNELY